MDKNKFSRFCTIWLIDDNNHSKIFISEKNKYYIRHGGNRSLCINILNRFKDIKKSDEINVLELTDIYYNIDKFDRKKYCTMLLIDDIKTSIIFISDRNMYNIRYDDDDCDESVYYKILNYFDRNDRSDIVNLINNNGYKHDITLLVDNSKIFICENLWWWCIKKCPTYYWTVNYHIY